MYNHKEYMKTYLPKYYQKHKEKLDKVNKEWTQNHRERSNEIKKKWAENNQETKSLRIRKSHLKTQYGMSIADYNQLFVLQYGKCAICKRHQSEFKRRLVVDHDHKTGKVRGLLCNPCNTRLVPTIEYKSHLIEVVKSYLKVEKI